MTRRAGARYDRCLEGANPLPPPTDDLAERAHRAVTRARQQVRQAEVLVAARQLLKEPSVLVTHCAWCGRYALAGHWLEADERPRFLPPQLAHATTHGICPPCLDDLRQRAISR